MGGDSLGTVSQIWFNAANMSIWGSASPAESVTIILKNSVPRCHKSICVCTQKKLASDRTLRKLSFINLYHDVVTFVTPVSPFAGDGLSDDLVLK